MRIWDQIEPKRLCRQHLLGEHRELHAIFAILTKGSEGYANHPEVKRWRSPEALAALEDRHDALVSEMQERGYRHRSPLPITSLAAPRLAAVTPPAWDNQEAALAAKNCECVTNITHNLPST